MKAVRKWQGLATLGGVFALAAGTAGLAPGASASPTVHECGNKSYTIEIQNGEGEAPSKFKLSVKAISAQRVSCQAAYKLIGLIYKDTTGKTPEKYKCAAGHFKVPAGRVPEVCTRPGIKIKFAGQGG